MTEENEPIVTTPEKVMDGLVETYAWWPAGNGFVMNTARPDSQPMTLTSFKNTMAPWSWEEPVKAGSNKMQTVNPADRWIKHHARVEVAGLQFDPTTPERIIEQHGEKFVNLFTGLPHEAGEVDSGAVAVFRDFLVHLLPDKREREWFAMWLAAKLQKPWLPNAAVVMAAENGGCGRGTLMDLLRGVLGPRHVSNPKGTQILGIGGQGQYTDWIAAKLLVTCEELLASGDGDSVMQWRRNDLYERLKGLVDPRARTISIIRKGLPNYQTDVYASFLFATNHLNALPVDHDDRRFAVLLNGERLKDHPDLMERLEPWRDKRGGFSEAFAQSVFRHLLTVEVDWTDVREAPHDTVGRKAMLAANETPMQAILEQVLAQVPGDFILGPDLIGRVNRAVDASPEGDDIKSPVRQAHALLTGPNPLGWRKMHHRQTVRPKHEKGGTTRHPVFYRETVGEAVWTHTPLEERPALWEAAHDPNNKLTPAQHRAKEIGLRLHGKSETAG